VGDVKRRRKSEREWKKKDKLKGKIIGQNERTTETKRIKSMQE
jgi:hypothetical protein